MSGRDRNKEGQSLHKAIYPNASDNKKFSRAPPGKCLSALPFFCVPKSDLKSRFRYRWITGYEPEPEGEFSEVAGRVQQNSGILISSLFCRREKILDGFPLWFLGFFHWPQNLRGFACPFPSWYFITESPPVRRAGSTAHQCHSQNQQQGPVQGKKQLLRKHLNPIADMQANRGRTKCIKRTTVSKSAGSQDQPNPAPRCFSSAGAFTQQDLGSSTILSS